MIARLGSWAMSRPGAIRQTRWRFWAEITVINSAGRGETTGHMLAP